MDAIDLFTTERLVAERVRPDHLAQLLRMDRDPRIMNNLGGVRSEEESREYLLTNIQHWERYGHGLWMLSYRADGRFVGRAALRHRFIGGNDELALGYALVPEFWGMGLATEVVKAIVELAFRELGFDTLVAGTLPNNRASRRVMEKVGGRYEKDTFYKHRPHVLYRFEP